MTEDLDLCVLYFVAGDREMNAKVKALSEQARKLTPEERIELIEDLQHSLHPNPEIDRLWAEEAKDRLAAYLRGEMEARTLDAWPWRMKVSTSSRSFEARWHTLMNGRMRPGGPARRKRTGSVGVHFPQFLFD
jgi:hypothetical protein